MGFKVYAVSLSQAFLLDSLRNGFTRYERLLLTYTVSISQCKDKWKSPVCTLACIALVFASVLYQGLRRNCFFPTSVSQIKDKQPGNGSSAPWSLLNTALAAPSWPVSCLFLTKGSAGLYEV